MPDDAIERAMSKLELWFFRDITDEQRMKLLGLLYSAAVVPEIRDLHTQRRCLRAAFAQQAPEGWMLVPEVCSERWLYRAKKLLGADAAEAQIIWSAMLDAAPSVTLGEVG